MFSGVLAASNDRDHTMIALAGRNHDKMTDAWRRGIGHRFIG
jgi:hypothetical protein